MYNGSALSVKMLDNGIAEMIFDLQGESVNKFDAKTVNELAEAVELLDSADDVKGLLITSSKSVFIVGADIMEFIPMFASGEHTADAHQSPPPSSHAKTQNCALQ